MLLYLWWYRLRNFLEILFVLEKGWAWVCLLQLKSLVNVHILMWQCSPTLIVKRRRVDITLILISARTMQLWLHQLIFVVLTLFCIMLRVTWRPTQILRVKHFLLIHSMITWVIWKLWGLAGRSACQKITQALLWFYSTRIISALKGNYSVLTVSCWRGWVVILKSGAFLCLNLLSVCLRGTNMNTMSIIWVQSNAFGCKMVLELWYCLLSFLISLLIVVNRILFLPTGVLRGGWFVRTGNRSFSFSHSLWHNTVILVVQWELELFACWRSKHIEVLHTKCLLLFVAV